MAHKYETIIFTQNNNVAEITLNRPQAANTLNLKMCEELADAAIICDEDPEIRAVLLTGSGEKMFSGGGDISEFVAAGEDLPALTKRMTHALHSAISRFARGDAPFVIAVNGSCGGGGLSLAASGDLVFATDKARFTVAYTSSGLSPDGSSSYFLPRRIGERRARELCLTNRALSAQEALEWGLINYVVSPDQLMEEARALAIKLAAGPTLAYGASKQLLNDTFNNGLETQMELEARAIARVVRSKDVKEGISAFLEKRKPGYSGR